jgi:hypothetical protein
MLVSKFSVVLPILVCVGLLFLLLRADIALAYSPILLVNSAYCIMSTALSIIIGTCFLRETETTC